MLEVPVLEDSLNMQFGFGFGWDETCMDNSSAYIGACGTLQAHKHDYGQLDYGIVVCIAQLHQPIICQDDSIQLSCVSALQECKCISV